MTEPVETAAWQEVSLTDVLVDIVDNRGRSCPTEESGFPLIATNCVKGDRLYPTFENIRYISEETRQTWFRGHPVPGDILFVCKGSPGRVALTPNPVPFAIAQDMVALRANPEVIDGRFLFYVIRSPQVQHEIANLHVGTMIPHFKKGDFHRLKFPIPKSVDEQRRIAGVLGALDDLVEVNRGLIQDLDDALVSSWRIAVGETSMSISIGEIAEISKGLSYKGAFLSDRGLPLINMGCFGVDGRFKESGLKWYADSEVKSKTRLVKGDLVVVNTDLTQSKDILARPIVNPYEHATSTHHTYQVRVPGGEAQRFWLYCALRDESVRRRLISYATGTTVAALPADALTSQEIPWAEEAAISEWWACTEPFFESQRALHEEVKELESTRNELLPLLMSGRIRVADEVAA
jgi:type I restriction enzyme S subunit